MELSDLLTYAYKKYHIRAIHKWPDHPTASVLCDPDNNQWLALLMSQWDEEKGIMIQRCDIKCGRDILNKGAYPFLSLPFKLKGPKWVGIDLNQCEDKKMVFELFDQAIRLERESRFTIILPEISSSTAFSETRIGHAARPEKHQDDIPQKILDMMSLYIYGDPSFKMKCENFYRQGKFMEDYVDDQPWGYHFKSFFTTYHDLNIKQLRGYFTWRKYVRRGQYKSIAPSFAYLYIYELISGIGCKSDHEAISRLIAFKKRFVDTGMGDEKMAENISRWSFEFAITHHLDIDLTRRLAPASIKELDHFLIILKEPRDHSDEEIFEGLSYFNKQKIEKSILLKKYKTESVHLFATLWRSLLRDDPKFFSSLFGEEKETIFFPFSNAIYWQDKAIKAERYEFDSCRCYYVTDGEWKVRSYQSLYFDKARLNALMHEADRAFRRYLGVGHYLKKKEEESWATPLIENVLKKEKERRLETSRPKIIINLNDLAKIREDAAVTRDSLLTEEEIADPEITPAEDLEGQANEDQNGYILKELLQGQDVGQYLERKHLLPSVVADNINEQYFDEIGDNIVEYDSRELHLIEDYKEDIADILGGTG